jgi:hypothetical protein
MQKIISKFILLNVILFLIVSCANKEEATYLDNQSYSNCNMICIGETEFKHQSGAFRYFDDSDSSRGTLGFYYSVYTLPNYCLMQQYTWDAINQTEIDHGVKICSAEIINYTPHYQSSGWWHCGAYHSNKDRKSQIIQSLKLCEKKVKKEGHVRTVSADQMLYERRLREQERIKNQKITQAKNTCREFGFTSNESLADCALKIYQTEIELSQSNIGHNSSDLLAKQMQLNNSILLMQQGLKLMSPPSRPTLNCMITLLGWTCN